MVIFGCGARGKSILKLLFYREDKILCCTDNNESLWETDLEGVRVVSPDFAVDKYSEALFVIANKMHSSDIAQQLNNMGIPEEQIWIY